MRIRPDTTGFDSAARPALLRSAAVLGAAVGTAIGGFISTAVADAVKSNSKLVAQLGLSPADSKRAGQVAGKVYSAGFGDSLGAVNDAVRAVVTGIGTKINDADLSGITKKALLLKDVFEQDVSKAAEAVGALLRSGLAKDANEAFDVVVRGFQLGADRGDDFVDTLREYGAQFQKFGLDARTTTGLLTQSMAAGARNSDLVADAIKEFSIRAVDGSKLTAEGFRGIGLNAEVMAGRIGKGGKSATDALDLTLDRLRAVKDPVLQAQLAVALFGTQAEDLGAALFAMDPSNAVAALGDVAGAADAATKSVHANIFTMAEGWVRTARTKLVEIGAMVAEQVPNLLAAFSARDTQGIGEVLDNIFGNTGTKVSLFRDVAEQVLPVLDQVRAVFANLRDVGASIAQVLGASLGGSLMLAWEAFKLILPALVSITKFLADNEGVVYGLAAAYVALSLVTRAHTAYLAIEAAGGILKWIAAGNKAQALTKVWTAVQWAWNAAMSANPIGLIIVGIGALIAGLVYAYRNSETFRNVVQGAFRAVAAAGLWMWENVLQPVWAALQSAWTAVADAVVYAWDHWIKPTWAALSAAASWLWDSVLRPAFSAISTAWSALAGALAWAYEHVIKPVWSALQVAGKILFAVLVVGVFGPIVLAWKALTASISWAWENILKPTWSAIETAAMWLWDNALRPAFTAIGLAWGALLRDIEWAYDNILQPIWQAFRTAAVWLYEHVLLPVFKGIVWYWETTLAGMKWAYENVLLPTWEALQSAAKWLYENVLLPIFTDLRNAWDAALRGMKWVYDNILSPMWSTFQDAIGAVSSAFGKAVDAIGVAWGKIREHAAKPINFVIGTVLNDGLFAAFNSIIDTLGLSASWKLSKLPLVTLAAGGRVPGYSPNDKADNIPAMLTAGEWVQPVSAVDYYGAGVMEAIRRRQIPREALQGVLHRAEGGPVYQQLFAKVRSAFPRANLNSGQRNTNDYHGQGLAVDIGEIGVPGGNGTPFLAAVNRWIYDSFKAQTLELIYDGAGDDRPDLKNGRDFTYDAATRAQHANHVHWAAASANGLGAGGGGGGGGWFDVLGRLKDSITAPLRDFYAKFGENALTRPMKEVPFKMVDKLWTKAKDAVSGAFNNVVTFFTGDSASGSVKDIVRQVAATRGWGSGAQWDAIDWIVSRESSWNPNAANPSSSARGLFQKMTNIHGALESTIEGQANWGLNYIAGRYGTPTAAKAFWERNHWYADGGKVGIYDSGGILGNGDVGVNRSGKPERVLSPSQTEAFEEWLRRGGGGADAPLVENLNIHVGDKATAKDGLDEAMFQLRRIKRGGAAR